MLTLGHMNMTARKHKLKLSLGKYTALLWGKKTFPKIQGNRSKLKVSMPRELCLFSSRLQN